MKPQQAKFALQTQAFTNKCLVFLGSNILSNKELNSSQTPQDFFLFWVQSC